MGTYSRASLLMVHRVDVRHTRKRARYPYQLSAVPGVTLKSPKHYQTVTQESFVDAALSFIVVNTAPSYLFLQS